MDTKGFWEKNAMTGDLVRIFNACYPEFRMGEEAFEKQIVSGAYVLLEKTETGEPAGFALLSKNAIRFLSVLPALQGKGYGTKLLKQCEDRIRAEGYTEITLGGSHSQFMIGADRRTWGFFEKNGYSYDDSCDEMLLKLKSFDKSDYPLSIPSDVQFGWYGGDMEALHAAVAEVEPSWVKYFSKEDRIYVATVKGEIASFCLVDTDVENYLAPANGRVGMPGCVGTVPKYRKRGIGLALVANATQYLKEEGMDISFIFYTEVANWYEKLGYKTFLTECFGKKEIE